MPEQMNTSDVGGMSPPFTMPQKLRGYGVAELDRAADLLEQLGRERDEWKADALRGHDTEFDLRMQLADVRLRAIEAIKPWVDYLSNFSDNLLNDEGRNTLDFYGYLTSNSPAASTSQGQVGEEATDGLHHLSPSVASPIPPEAFPPPARPSAPPGDDWAGDSSESSANFSGEDDQPPHVNLMDSLRRSLGGDA